MIRRVSLLILVAAASCGPPPPVRFGGEIAELSVEDYEKIRARWTRHVHVTRDYDTAIDADLTLLSPQYRGVYIARVADMRQLTSAQREQLVRDQHADAEKYVDLVINMQAARWDWNDLTATRSVWTITLVDDQGHEVGSPEIIQNPVKPEVLTALYGPFGLTEPFIRSYRVRFARVPPSLLGPDTRWVTVRIAGPLGGAEAKWEAK